MRRTRSVKRASLILLLMVTTACGSTVQVAGTLPAGNNGLTVPGTTNPVAGGTTGLGGSTGAVAPVGGSGTTGGGGVPGVPGSTSGTGGSGTSGGASGATSGTTTATPRNVPGIKDGFIKIGIIRTTNAEAAYTAIGASGLAGSGFGDRMTEALVNEINRTGIKGLKIKLVTYTVDLNDPSTPADVHQQRACAKWTQDDRVFAAFAGEGEVLDACLAKAGVLEICSGCVVSTYDAKAMNGVPLLYSPNAVTVDRQVDFYVKGLIEGNYFTGAPGPPKVGFITYDDPVRRRQTPRLEAELKRRTGLTFAEKGFLPIPDGGEGDARALSAIQSFVLQFKTAGVNRVLMLDNSGQAAAYTMQAADKNAYYPRWGFNSTSTPGGLFNAGVVPASQLPGMTVVGWYPAADIGMKEDTQRPPGLAACLALFKKAGMTMASDTDFATAGVFCDRFFFLRDVLVKAPALAVNQFGPTAASIGAGFPSSLTYGTNQGRGRRDGGNIYRVGAYNQPCNCFRYVGQPQPM